MTMFKLFRLRRIIRAIERLAAAAEDANSIRRERLRLDYPTLGRDDRPRKVEISAPTVADWQARIDAERARRDAGR